MTGYGFTYIERKNQITRHSGRNSYQGRHRFRENDPFFNTMLKGVLWPSGRVGYFENSDYSDQMAFKKSTDQDTQQQIKRFYGDIGNCEQIDLIMQVLL